MILSASGRSRHTPIESSVRELIASHPRFSAYIRTIQIEYARDTLILTGELPSYYAKQLLQEALRSLAYIRRIDNRICVVRSAARSQLRDD